MLSGSCRPGRSSERTLSFGMMWYPPSLAWKLATSPLVSLKMPVIS